MIKHYPAFANKQRSQGALAGAFQKMIKRQPTLGPEPVRFGPIPDPRCGPETAAANPPATLGLVDPACCYEMAFFRASDRRRQVRRQRRVAKHP